MTTEPMAFLWFALELTAISMGLARQYVGPTWRDVLGTALLDIEVQHLDQDETGPNWPGATTVHE
jgi:hypothetical protein